MSAKTTLLKGLGASATAGTVATGGFFAWKGLSQTSDITSRLTGEGLSVADVNKKGPWSAIYLTKKDVEGFSDFVDASDQENAVSQLQKKCSELLSASPQDENYEKSYEQVKKWCVNPELKTIEMQFVFDEREWATAGDDFKSLFTLHQNDDNFINAVQSSTGFFNSSMVLDEAKTEVETWCNSLKSKTPEGDDLQNAVSWCTKPESNFKSFMDKKGFRMLSESEWASRFSSLKGGQDSDLSTDVGADDSDGSKLKGWCEGKKLDTAQIHTLGSDLNKIETRCFVKKE
ncbi:hypothetical protein HF1_09310 [Mycoplasma haemofelis str. Langford 1]|uniref:Uncharacterized protein n=1 Tax=Mycoplasma haemofelis (strain Langford 1) TaxID=941640 RepID=E8ZIG8_MYCHL|nr:hypothetical protein [Mycoplasma haemofelis]CBY92939.1 hypothetical protein HF1_09310 [Mycoplasma haemofelis str. Langford 1]